MFTFSSLDLPIVVTPMAGGPSTPELVAALADIGGTGFVPTGYLDAAAMADQIRATRELTDRPFGVNLFVPNDDEVDGTALDAYRAALQPVADRFGVDLPQPSHDDEDFATKIAALQQDPVAFVSFTFGLLDRSVIEPLQAAGIAVGATVTSLDEARAAAAVDYDFLVVQGPEAGGHRGTHHASTTPDDTPLLPLLAQLVAEIDLPVIAAGGLIEAPAIADALSLADAVQLGTAYLLATEAGTSAVHRAALGDSRFTETIVTRAFTGRPARALRNAFTDQFADAPPSYPAVHQLTQPLRRAAAAAGEPDYVHLWAGIGWRSIGGGSAGDIARALWAEVASLVGAD